MLLLKLLSDVKHLIIDNRSKLAQPVIDKAREYNFSSRDSIQKLLDLSFEANPQNE